MEKQEFNRIAKQKNVSKERKDAATNLNDLVEKLKIWEASDGVQLYRHAERLNKLAEGILSASGHKPEMSLILPGEKIRIADLDRSFRNKLLPEELELEKYTNQLEQQAKKFLIAPGNIELVVNLIRPIEDSHTPTFAEDDIHSRAMLGIATILNMSINVSQSGKLTDQLEPTILQFLPNTLDENLSRIG